MEIVPDDARRPSRLAGVWSVLTWVGFPLVPSLLGTSYHQILNPWGLRGGPDPRDWEWGMWVLMLGPLVGYGFLAGATLEQPDDPVCRGMRGWISRRSIWVGVGPWVGFLIGAGVFFAIVGVKWAYPRSEQWSLPSLPAGWQNSWLGWIGERVLIVVVVGALAYGWIFVAWATLRRARRLNRFRRSLARGLAVAAGFVGSLFGSFWAITEVWRGYFFDPRIVPILIGGASLALMSGCAATETFGEVRRKELFQAMLLAWLLGLALAWWWWSRSRPKPPGPA